MYREFVHERNKISLRRDQHGNSKVDLTVLSPKIRVKQRRLLNGTGSLVPQAKHDEPLITRATSLLNKFDLNASADSGMSGEKPR